MKRIIAVAAITALGLAAALAIHFLRPDTSREEKATLRVGFEANPASLDPRLATDGASSRVNELVHAYLLRLDEKADLALDLAESYETPDPLTYVFHLKRGVRFHDGTELTAEDVKYTFDSIRDPAFKSPLARAYEKLARVEAVDRHTVKFVLTEPFASFLIQLVVGIVPRAAAEKQGADFAAHPVGAGPFRLAEWSPDQRLVLAAHEDYYGGRARLDRLIYEIIPDNTTRALALLKGSVDFLQNGIDPQMLDKLRAQEHLKMLEAPGVNYSYLGFNLTDPALGKPAVRRAVAHAIDRRAIITNLLKGLGSLATGPLAPSNWAYEGNVEVYPYDPDRARALLDQAGYPDPDGPGGLPRLTLVYKTSQNDLRKRIGESLQYYLEQVGVKLEMRTLEWGTFYDDIKRGNFQIFTLTWVGITDPDIFRYLFHSQAVPPAGANRGRYINPEIDALIERGGVTADRAERRRIYSQIQKILARDLPYVSLWYNANLAVMKKDVQGFTLYPPGSFWSFRAVRGGDGKE